MAPFLARDFYCRQQECQKEFNELKDKLVSAPILVFLDWIKIFHVHIYASSIALGAALT